MSQPQTSLSSNRPAAGRELPAPTTVSFFLFSLPSPELALPLSYENTFHLVSFCCWRFLLWASSLRWAAHRLLPPDPTIMGANMYNRMFTLHGVVMIFLFMIPASLASLGNFLSVRSSGREGPWPSRG